MDIKVSIIIPVYNVSSYLDVCLTSCVNQTFKDIEIVVVNDGSTDGSSDIIQQYAVKDDRIKVVTKENQGLVYARKSGLEAACGEYVFFLDGDDSIQKDAIEALYKEAVISGADHVMGNLYSVSENRKQKGESICELRGLVGQELLLCKLKRREWRIWGILIRKCIFDDLVYIQIVMGEDLFFNMQICLKVKKSSVVDIPLYNYVLRPGSITNQKKKIVNQLMLDMVKTTFFLLETYSYNQCIREKIYMIYYYFFLNCIRHKDMDAKTVLFDYYWNNQAVISYLQRDKKYFYLIIKMFIYYPRIASLMAKIYMLIIVLKKKCNEIENRLKNKLKML